MRHNNIKTDIFSPICKKYRISITVLVYIYGAAGHGKGLIDAMSAFGCKNLLRMDILGEDAWWADSKEMCKHLQRKGCYIVIFLLEKQMKTEKRKLRL